eukprot:4831708-Pleurochrysis_carterae.AAC.1
MVAGEQEGNVEMVANAGASESGAQMDMISVVVRCEDACACACARGCTRECARKCPRGYLCMLLKLRAILCAIVRVL